MFEITAVIRSMMDAPSRPALLEDLNTQELRRSKVTGRTEHV